MDGQTMLIGHSFGAHCLQVLPTPGHVPIPLFSRLKCCERLLEIHHRNQDLTRRLLSILCTPCEPKLCIVVVC